MKDNTQKRTEGIRETDHVAEVERKTYSISTTDSHGGAREFWKSTLHKK
jgi:hypothetical protein